MAQAGWHKEDIKAEIRKRGKTLKAVAEAYGVSASTVRNAVIHPSHSGEKVIADFLKVPLHELWPDRWDCNGVRKLSTRKRQFSQAA